MSRKTYLHIPCLHQWVGQAAAAPARPVLCPGLSATLYHCHALLLLSEIGSLSQVPCPSMKAPESLPPARQLQCLWPGVWQKARNGGACQALASVCWAGFSPGSGSLKGHTLSPCCSPWGIKCSGQELGLSTRLPGPRPWLMHWVSSVASYKISDSVPESPHQKLLYK